MDTPTLSTLVDLLKQPKSSKSPRRGDEFSNEENHATIFDLGNSDRFRVLKLIEELLDSQEETDKLKSKLEEEKIAFRDKRNTLLKKLDAVNEKYEKALMDIQMLKEVHAESLCNLEKKITTVSTKFESSVDEILELRKSNAELKQENLTLRKLNSESTASVTMIQEENSRLNLELEKSRIKEKTLKKQFKHLSSKFNIYPEIEQTNSNPSCSSSLTTLRGISMSSNQHGPHHRQRSQNSSSLPRHTLESYKQQQVAGAGGGDCGDHNELASKDVNTIKAPLKTRFPEDGSSTFAFPNSSDNFVRQRQQQFNTTALTSLEDMTILENLFFRF